MSIERDARRQADEMIRAIEERIFSKLGTQAFLNHRWGRVAVVTGQTCSVFLGGDDIASPNFRIPADVTVETGQTVRVVIDPRGDRHIDNIF